MPDHSTGGGEQRDPSSVEHTPAIGVGAAHFDELISAEGSPAGELLGWLEDGVFPIRIPCETGADIEITPEFGTVAYRGTLRPGETIRTMDVQLLIDRILESMVRWSYEHQALLGTIHRDAVDALAHGYDKSAGPDDPKLRDLWNYIQRVLEQGGAIGGGHTSTYGLRKIWILERSSQSPGDWSLHHVDQNEEGIGIALQVWIKDDIITYDLQDTRTGYGGKGTIGIPQFEALWRDSKGQHWSKQEQWWRPAKFLLDLKSGLRMKK